MTHSEKILSVQNLSKILENITEEEREYLKEALGCAERKYFRASVVMGWNAAMNRVHKVIEKISVIKENYFKGDSKYK